MLQREGFLLGESVDTFGDGAQGDLLLDLEDSPSLLVELGAYPELWEDDSFFFWEVESPSLQVWNHP